DRRGKSARQVENPRPEHSLSDGKDDYCGDEAAGSEVHAVDEPGGDEQSRGCRDETDQDVQQESDHGGTSLCFRERSFRFHRASRVWSIQFFGGVRLKTTTPPRPVVGAASKLVLLGAVRKRASLDLIE